MKLILITGPASAPVSVSEAKSHLRVDISTDDTLIGTYITAATQYVELHLRRALITQTHELVLDGWPGKGRISLPLAPLISVTSVTVTDNAGSAAVFSISNYIVDTAGEPGAVVLKSTASWPATVLQEVNGIKVRFVAGYGAAAAVPDAIKQAILLAVGSMYEHREDVQVSPGIVSVSLPLGVFNLLMPYRVWREAN